MGKQSSPVPRAVQLVTMQARVPTQRLIPSAMVLRKRQFFTTTEPKPGGAVDPAVYPKSLATDAPQALATVKLPG